MIFAVTVGTAPDTKHIFRILYKTLALKADFWTIKSLIIKICITLV